MGLESHVDHIIKQHAPELYEHYYWDDGLVVDRSEHAQHIMNVLDNTREFGATRFDIRTHRIKFSPYKGSTHDSIPNP